MKIEQIAHDLAIAYVTVRHSPEVSGDFNVYTTSDGEATGSGSVSTERMADIRAPRVKYLETGETAFFGLYHKLAPVEDGFKVDEELNEMITDYRLAYDRILSILQKQESD